MNKLNRMQHEALLRIQWAGNDNDCKGSYCILCRNYDNAGHRDDCAIGNAIRVYGAACEALELIKNGKL